MKKLFLYSAAALLALGGFTSCSDDDPVTPGQDLKEQSFSTNKGLNLELDGKPLLGKSVTFKPGTGNTATITLAGEDLDMGSILGEIIGMIPTKADAVAGLKVPTCGVIPGSPSVEIPITLVGTGDNCTFEGSQETEYCTFNYSGTVMTDSLSFSISDLKLKNTSLAGTWNITTHPNVSPIHITWESDALVEVAMQFVFGKDTITSVSEMPIIDIASMAIGMSVIDNPLEKGGKTSVGEIIPNILKSVEFCEDGNIIAKYVDVDNEAHPELVSPKGLAQYVVNSDNSLTLFLNPQQIISTTLSNATKTRTPDIMPAVESLLTNLLPLLKNGIPVGYTPLTYNDWWANETVTVENSYSFTLGKEVLLPILKAVAPIITDPDVVDSLMKEISEDPQMKDELGDIAPMMKGVLMSLPKVIDSTKEIKLGLNMEKK